jgi:hypothetical protein
MRDPWKDSKTDWWFKTSGSEKNALAAVGLFGLLKKSMDMENATVQRYPKCQHHSFYKVHPGEKKTPERVTGFAPGAEMIPMSLGINFKPS